MKARRKKNLAWRIVKPALIILGSILLILILLPIFFRPQLVAFAKKQLNKQLTSTVDFDDVRISLLRNFPRLDLRFKNLTITGNHHFQNDTLLVAPTAHVVTNFKTLFRSDVEVYEISLEDPMIHARVDSFGRQNFDIIRTSSTPGDTSSTGDFTLALKKYSIQNGYVRYDDDAARIYAELQHFNHEGKGDFTDVRYKMNARTKADSVDFRYGGILYLDNAVIDIPLELDIDNDSLHYVFSSAEFFVNSVPLRSTGDIRSVNDSSDRVEISLQSRQSDFRNILTLIPGVYTDNLNDFKTSGKATIDGRVYGLSTPGRIPNFDVKVDVEDGMIQNPEFPETIRGIFLNGRIVNTGGHNDSTVIRFANGRAFVGAEPLQFALGIRQPVSAMLIDLQAKGKIQLEKLSSILRLGDTDMRGLLNADIAAAGPLRAFREKEADAIHASGYLQADGFYYKDPSILPFEAGRADLRFNRSEAAITVENGRYNNTSLNASGSIFNFFNFLFVGAPLRGKLNARTPEINLAHWASNSATASNAVSAKPFVVPAGLLLDITAHADRLISEKLTLTDLDGRLIFSDRKLLFENVSGKGLGGTLQVDGSYSSAVTPMQPDITLNYKVQNLDVRETLRLLVTAKSLMPIAEYLSGTLTSELSASGKLGDNFSPVLNTLDGNGNLLLLNGLLEKFKPLESIAERLDIDRLKSIATKEIRNRFSFENGLVNVLPFKFTVFNDYDFEVAGKHGFDNSIDYAVKLTLPRKDLGTKGVQLYNGLISKAGKLGLNIQPSEKISFFIRLGGTIRAPSVQIELDKSLGSEFDQLKEQAEEQLKSKLDSAKNVVKDTLSKIKDEIVTGIKDRILGKDTSQQKPKDSSSKKKVIKDVINIFTNRNKNDSTEE